jgi:hypothetical protein
MMVDWSAQFGSASAAIFAVMFCHLINFSTSAHVIEVFTDATPVARSSRLRVAVPGAVCRGIHHSVFDCLTHAVRGNNEISW